LAPRPSGSDTAPTAAIPAPAGATDPTAVRRFPDRRGGKRLLAGLALVAGIGAGVLVASSVGGDGGGEGTTSTVDVAPAQPTAPELTDPAQQAPALSEWIRANSE
jgi:hypothetical protein